MTSRNSLPEPAYYLFPVARVTPDGSWEDGPCDLCTYSEADDYIKRIGAPLFTADQVRAALSHAAGQDGEQCRAASGESEALATWLDDFGGGFADAEGFPTEASRNFDRISQLLRALSRGVPEGMVRDAERYRFIRENNLGSADYEIMMGNCGADLDAAVDAAIAAKRKEG